MTKHLYSLSARLQEQLLGAAMLYPQDEWARHAPRVQIDAWATLWRWHVTGEQIVRLTDEAEGAILARPLPVDLLLSTAPLRHESLALQLPDRSEWIVIARHAPAPAVIPVYGPHTWAYAQPLLTYVASSPRGTPEGIASGYVNLIDQPTPRDLRLIPGTVTDIATERVASHLTEADVVREDYHLALAIHALFSR